MSLKQALAHMDRTTLYVKLPIFVLLREQGHKILHKSWKPSDHDPVILCELPFLAKHGTAETQAKQEEE